MFSIPGPGPRPQCDEETCTNLSARTSEPARMSSCFLSLTKSPSNLQLNCPAICFVFVGQLLPSCKLWQASPPRLQRSQISRIFPKIIPAFIAPHFLLHRTKCENLHLSLIFTMSTLDFSNPCYIFVEWNCLCCAVCVLVSSCERCTQATVAMLDPLPYIQWMSSWKFACFHGGCHKNIILNWFLNLF